MISRLIHVSILHFFVWLNNIPLYDIYILLIRSPVDGHLGCFHFLAIVDNAELFLYKFLFEHLFSILLIIFLGVELSGYMVTLCLTLYLFI